MSGKLTSLLASQDMTQGSPSGNLIRFSVPLLIGNLAQQLYSTVDTIVVGQFVSTQALAAVGSTSSIINMLVGLSAGLSTGASVIISQCYGAHDHRSLHDAVHTTITATFVMSVLCTFLGILIVDYRHPPTNNDITMARWFLDSGCPFAVVANKMDKLKKSERVPNLQLIRQDLELPDSCPVIPFSAEKGDGRDALVKLILDTVEPK